MKTTTGSLMLLLFVYGIAAILLVGVGVALTHIVYYLQTV